MSESFTLMAEPRHIIGKKVKQLRRQGLIPAVVYGQKESVAVQLPAIETKRILRKADKNSLFTLNIGDKENRTVLIRELQHNVIRHSDILHIDFLEVDMTQTVTTEAVLVRSGISQPDKDGLGRVTMMLRSIHIECRPDALISEYKVDISLIKTPHDTIHVRDLAFPEGVHVLTDADTLVATFTLLRKEEESATDSLEESVVHADKSAE